MDPRKTPHTMPARHRTVLLFATLGAATVIVPAACKEAVEDTGFDAVAREVLAAVGPEVVQPALDAFVSQLETLDAALAAWEQAESGAPEASARADAQEAWTAAMLAWQPLEAMQIGPAGSSLTTVAGEDMRDEIYSWPTLNPCRVDEETAAGGFTSDTWFDDSSVNVYGLDALEHLLYAGADHACDVDSGLTAEGTWSGLGEDGVQAARAQMARVLAADTQARAELLVQRWSVSGDEFSTQLADATAYGSQTEAINAVFDALFYLELDTKDRKLGQPLGLKNCAETTCPGDVEHLQSGLAAPAIAANLAGFRSLFTGGDGAGFDDLLVAAEEPSLADTLLTELGQAEEAAAAFTGRLDEAIAAGDPAAMDLYDEIKDVADLLKGPVATVLLLQIPQEASGDAD